MLRTRSGPQPYPVRPLEIEGDPVPSLLDAHRLARVETSGLQPATSLLVPSGLLSRAERRAHRSEARAAALRRELENPVDPAALRGIGDLLLARFRDIPRGTDHVTLEGFDGNPVLIDLDPTLSPQENAARRYDEAARIERARSALPRRIAEAESERNRWDSLLTAVRAGDVPWKELEDALGPERSAAPRGRGGQAPALPYRRFTSTSGCEIRVGRGARQNDELTFHHAGPDDIWLHAHQSAGAHVILRWGRKEPPSRQDLIEAATLAALHSGARGSATVSVLWTWRKYVRKPRKSAPGKVMAERIETLLVEPDPDLAERLEAKSRRESLPDPEAR